MTDQRSNPAGTTALVTGGTDGIGVHIACGLAASGAEVIVTGRDRQRGEQAVDKIRAVAGHGRVSFAPVDHSTVGANEHLAEELGGSLPHLDVLVNNVGRVFSTREVTADGFEATLALCFLAPVVLTEGLLPLLTRNRARVVNMNTSAYKMWRGDPFDDVASEAGYVGIRAHAHAKLLNLIWTFALAERLAPQSVMVNAVNPGAAWTPGTAQLTPEAVPAWRWVWPVVRFFQRRGSPVKAAQDPIWLASSPEADGLSGAYVEKRTAYRPKVAADPANQRMVVDLAERLVRQAPAAGRRSRP